MTNRTTLRKKFTIGLSLIYLFLLSTNAVSQPGRKLQQDVSAVDTIYAKIGMIVRNGNNDTIEIAAYKNGKKNGKQTLFFNDRSGISRIAFYTNDLLDGKLQYYSHGTKNIVRIENYKPMPKVQKSILHGVYKVFNTENKVVELFQYRDGARNGKYEISHPNGQLKEKGIYENNLNIGRKQTFATDGALLKDENYIIIKNPSFIEKTGNPPTPDSSKKELPTKPEYLSLLNGKVKYYYANSQLSSDLIFKNGKKDGVCKEYYQDKNNNLKSIVAFKDGLEHGPFAYHRANGDLERKGIYYREIKSNDTTFTNVYDGTVETFHDNGKRERIENWKNFKKNGLQENFHYASGELYTRFFLIDNLKSGAEERFDKDGGKTYEAFFEIIEKDGKKVSQQTGTETSWEKGKVKSTVEWKNGLRDGVTKIFYSNGQPEQIMNFSDGKLHGIYLTFYENGKPKEEYNKQPYSGTGNSENVGWNSVYDESGIIKRKFFATGNSKNIIDENFKNGKRSNLIIQDAINLEFTEEMLLSSVQWLRNAMPVFGFNLFTNQQLRSVRFQSGNQPPATANFTSDGNLIQITSAAGSNINDKKIQEAAKKIAQQYNPKWITETFATQAHPEGNYQWSYSDGSPFFSIGFKEGLPQGEWITYNPILKDTLFYGIFEKGLPIGKSVRKKIDGKTELRQEYYPNHKIKAYYRYGDEGMISAIYKNDSLGSRTFSEEYYPGGLLKSRSNIAQSSYINFSATGDTLSYNLLMNRKDSIRIERQFYDRSKLKIDRFNNLTTGKGYVKVYYENGKLQTSHELKNTKTHGPYNSFDQQGKLLATGNFDDGKRDGKWIKYLENGREEVSYFKAGEIILDQPSISGNIVSTCKCYDTSLPSGKIGFANSLSYFADYKSISPYIPKTIIPINDWSYDGIFYINLITNNDRNNGSTSFKLLLFNDFSFNYPVANHLKFNLNPCKTEGYIGNIEANVSYNFNTKELTYAQIQTKRISVSLEKSPLVDAIDNSPFQAYFNTDYLHFDAKGLQTIHFSKDRNDCYPPGIINDFMGIQIESAKLVINAQNDFVSAVAPLMKNEVMQFFGLDISLANINFDYEGIQLVASCERILVGTNYVAGSIFVTGKSKNDDLFTISESKSDISLKNLKTVLERKGFYRVKTEVDGNRLMIEFYTEK